MDLKEGDEITYIPAADHDAISPRSFRGHRGYGFCDAGQDLVGIIMRLYERWSVLIALA